MHFPPFKRWGKSALERNFSWKLQQLEGQFVSCPSWTSMEKRLFQHKNALVSPDRSANLPSKLAEDAAVSTMSRLLLGLPRRSRGPRARLAPLLRAPPRRARRPFPPRARGDGSLPRGRRRDALLARGRPNKARERARKDRPRARRPGRTPESRGILLSRRTCHFSQMLPPFP